MVVIGGAIGPGAFAGRTYKVLSTVTLPDGGCCYRIKSIAEASDRIVPESALVSGPAPFRVIGRSPTPLRQDLGSRPRPGGSPR
jgi:hypothetical protein